MTEQHSLNPTNPYASAKAGADRLVYSYCVTYDIPATILRPFNNYGPRQHLEKAIPRFISRALRNRPLTIHGTGENTRDWLYVRDCCKAVDCAMHVDLDKVRGQIINIGTGRELDLLSIAKLILSKVEKAEDLIEFIGDRPGQVQRHCASIRKAEQLLDWHPETSFEKGLDQTIEWYISHENWWREQIWMETVPIRNKRGEVEYH